ncbi:ion channel [Phenylobacterium sp.]|jgi:hypothetical protein|uniref:ion channel n=1 Tax=Phenylobacterium sp. TaxID=1871053 RepID=UPI002F3F16DC
MHPVPRELAVVFAMAAATIVIHLVGLLGLTRLVALHLKHLRSPWLALDRLVVPLGIASGLFLLHFVEVLAYAGVYARAEATHDLDNAIYLSAGAYSTAGWPDVIVPKGWRLVAAFESLNGMLLLGWSTAYLFQTLQRILQTDETHPLPEGAIATEPLEPLPEDPSFGA